MRQYTAAELAELADPSLEQHFLISSVKLALIVSAAGIQPNDAVVEVGAGAGTVARYFPVCRELTLIEIDERLVGLLRDTLPSANVIQGDALPILKLCSMDVLISNLPNRATDELLRLLPTLTLRTAIVTMSQQSASEMAPQGYIAELVTTIGQDDFSPWQATTSSVVKFTRVQ